MTQLDALLRTNQPFLTDGGFETWLFFQKGFEAPEFAAIALMKNEAARTAMREYFDGFLEMAEAARTGFLLDTNTWRGCTNWAAQLGLSPEEMLSLSRDAVTFAKDVRTAWQSRVSPIFINGVVGPAGDGYTPEELLDADAAQSLHEPQVGVLSASGVDMISAITMTNVGEAVGIVRAATAMHLPVVVSFTVETDGRLPTGETLGEAITATDRETKHKPIYYMVNCAHPDHFVDTLDVKSNWISRIGGLRANASRLSHAELDNAKTLDQGSPDEFGHLHFDLARRLPGLRVVGGCCGTDHRHVAAISSHLHNKIAA